MQPKGYQISIIANCLWINVKNKFYMYTPSHATGSHFSIKSNKNWELGEIKLAMNVYISNIMLAFQSVVSLVTGHEGYIIMFCLKQHHLPAKVSEQSLFQPAPANKLIFFSEKKNFWSSNLTYSHNHHTHIYTTVHTRKEKNHNIYK